jgi:hypothetical protein
MLTLAIPQSEPSAARNLGLADVGGEDGRRKTLRHSIVQALRLVERLVGQHVEDRRERLGVHDVGLRGIRTTAGATKASVAPSPPMSCRSPPMTSPPSARACSSAPTMSR